MHPISISRCPWKGSSPVVSVSSTISRTPALLLSPLPEDESPPLRHCSDGGKDRTHLRTRRFEPPRSAHDKIRRPALFAARRLFGQDRLQLFPGHARALQPAEMRALGRGRPPPPRVDPRVAAGLEQ